MPTPMTARHPLVLQLLETLGLPKNTQAFTLRAAVDEVVTVTCTYIPDGSDDAVSFPPGSAITRRYLLTEDEPGAPLVENVLAAGPAAEPDLGPGVDPDAPSIVERLRRQGPGPHRLNGVHMVSSPRGVTLRCTVPVQDQTAPRGYRPVPLQLTADEIHRLQSGRDVFVTLGSGTVGAPCMSFRVTPDFLRYLPPGFDQSAADAAPAAAADPAPVDIMAEVRRAAVRAGARRDA